ncbi:MAG: UDP-N-acetylmuramate--L-alanine ligase [Patescibacteria group bacterium]
MESIKKIYFIGIGGIGMSAAACIANELGFAVEGSDSQEVYSPAKNVIDSAKLNYHVGYNSENVKNSRADLYVLSAGEGVENPEVKFVVENNLPRAGFAELLYAISKENLRMVVTGTHGKTTTAGLLGHVLMHVDDSSFFTGGVLQNFGKNFYSGSGHYFIFEGDEYREQFDDPTPKFHFYKPDILVLTNLEFDHPDLFATFDDLQREFEQLIANLPKDGLLVYNADDINLSHLAMNTEVTSVSYAIDNEADYKIEQVKYENDYTTFEVLNRLSKNISSHLLGQTEEYKIQLPGKLNIYNSLAVVATLRALGFSQEQIQLDLVSYKGIVRRFEIVGVKNGIILIDDYAHHPTAVKATLDTAKMRYPNARIWAIFEPHTFSRTKATLDDLAKSFDAADKILISEIYPAREKIADATVESEDVISAIKIHNSKFIIRNSIRKVINKNGALNILKAELKAGDVVMIMAVGDFNRLAYELKEIL